MEYMLGVINITKEQLEEMVKTRTVEDGKRDLIINIPEVVSIVIEDGMDFFTKKIDEETKMNDPITVDKVVKGYIAVHVDQIYEIIDLVEKLGASTELTDIVVKLSDLTII